MYNKKSLSAVCLQSSLQVTELKTQLILPLDTNNVSKA